ncbi:M20/M25/M40 family metallo-hydrolase [Mesorhizobium sp. 43Arga]
MACCTAPRSTLPREFEGSVALIFQPSEENGRGGQRMVQGGIMDRFGISQFLARTRQT